jgi:hypothetical protein
MIGVSLFFDCLVEELRLRGLSQNLREMADRAISGDLIEPVA